MNWRHLISNQKNPLIFAPIPGLIRKIAVPVAVGSFFNTMFNVVDTFYGGLISSQALAALSLSFPIYFIIIAVGFGVGQGTTALIGNALGRGDQEEAQRHAAQGLWYGVLVSIVLTVGVIAAAPAIVESMGATDPEYKQMTLDYIVPLFYGTIFFITRFMANAILNAVGNTIPGRNAMIAGFFLNILLDPWFIYGGFGLPAMGIRGIAYATVLVQFLSAVYTFYEAFKTDLLSWESLRANLLPNLGAFGRISEQGFPNMLDMMGVSLGFFVLNFYAGRFGQNAVAALGAASRIEQIFLLPLLGFNVATLTLVASNNGARNYARVQDTFQQAIKYSSLVMLVTMIIGILFARPLMRVFTADPEIIEYGVSYVWYRCLALIPNAVFFMSSSALRGLKKPIWPLVWNLIRFAGLPWLLIYIFVERLGGGVSTIWSMSSASFFITAVIIWLIARQMLPKVEPKLAGENA
ncbi:MAG: MATE family efflux transporter [Chloroflexota bacterium]